jgi:Ca-activated chloride channel family protein
MNFFNPLSLLWAIPLSGLIILMYILKLRRKDVVVSSTFLWRQVIRDVQANAPFQKLRKNLLLFLQLLAALLLVLAITRPFWRGKGIGGRSVVIVVDTSASMGATDVKPNRLEMAKREALDVANAMRPEDQMMVVSASSKAEAATGFTSDRGELARAINSLTVHETGTNMRDAINLASALVATRDASEIDVISDGAFDPIMNVNLGKTHVTFHPVGKSGGNVGIAAVDYRHSLTGESKVQVFITVHNFDDRPHTFNVELRHENELLDAHEVTLTPGKENPDIFDLPEPQVPLSLNVKLDVKDDLSADNEAAMVIMPRKIIKALLVTDENVFLETGIRVDPNVDLSVAKLEGFRKPDGYDVVIFDGGAPKSLPKGNYLFVNCTADQSPATMGPSHENQSLIDPNRSHPVMRYVDFGTLRWTDMREGKPAGWAQELAVSESGPAIIAGQKEKMRALWLGFNLDLAHGRFPVTVGYPIFVSNAIRWLAHSDDTTEAQVRTGAPIMLDAPPSAGRITVTKPDGGSREVIISDKGGGSFDDSDRVGIYTASGADGFKRVFAANLADYSESNITPRKTADLGGGVPGEIGRQVTITREVWPWLAIVLLGLLGFEWYAFHRRVYVS